MSFDAAFLQARQDDLTALKQQLTKELGWLEDAARPVDLDQTQFGRLSRMDAISQQQMQKAAATATRERLRRVVQALNRLAEDDDYGWCDECGEAIETARLTVQPEARLCLGCQDAAERGES